ncbi:MAG: hypothetical protein ACK52J_01745 [bacterium]
MSNSIVGGNHFNAVTGFLCEETFLLTDSEDYADEELGSSSVEVIKGLRYII